MPNDSLTSLLHRYARLILLVGVGCLGISPSAVAAETTSPQAMSKTLVILKLDAQAPLALHTTFQENPPTLAIEFPPERVTGSLPEHSTIAKGVIQAITARYDAGSGPTPKRFIRSLQIALSAPYAYHVRSEPGRVVIEIEHPASISSAAVVEVGLHGGTVIGGFGPTRVDERFRAMQVALARATPTPWTLQLAPGLAGGPTFGEPQPAQASNQGQRASAPPGPSSAVTAKRRAMSATQASAASASVVWVFFVLSTLMCATVAVWFLYQGGAFQGLRRAGSQQGSGRLPSGVILIDQLVWRAFERQGFQLITEVELSSPLSGTLRVIMKDGVKAALVFVRNGPFFEKQTVERFTRAMREASVEQGYLVAAGSFTVPAQRVAKAHHVTLIGREQLIELLSTGAASEYVTRQLEQQHARLEEAKETLTQYASELDTLRRQRNEASWYLGEERAKSAKLESQLGELNQQLHHHEAELVRWEHEASKLHKQWDESQWYLGESRAHVQHLEEQFTSLQNMAKRAMQLEEERDRVTWSLGEERAKREALEQQLIALQQRMEESLSREQALEGALQGLKRVFTELRTHGERRRQVRMKISDALIELRNGSESPLFTGAARDISSTGIGLESPIELPAGSPLRLRLQLPGGDSIESSVRLIWQQGEGDPPRYQSGYRLMDLPRATRSRIASFIKQSQSSPA